MAGPLGAPIWPPITEPLLRERLGMDDAAFLGFIEAAFCSLPPRRCTAEALATALAYPWDRPDRSYLLDGETVELLDDLDPAQRAKLLADPAQPAAPLVDPALVPDSASRHPLLAFGSNGAPATLARKLAHLPTAERRLLVLVGELHGFDIGAAAHPTGYGTMAATPFESRGTAVRAAVLWVTAVQLTQLTWTEISYRLGRLAPTVFAPDQPAAEPVTSVLAYVSRWGTFCPGGAPVALAAVPATGRSAPALSQEEVLGAAAGIGFEADAGAAALVRAVFEDPAGFVAGAGTRIRASGRPLTADAWTPWAVRRGA